MTYEPYLDQLTALADPHRAEGMAQYHKVDRRYLGLANPQINDLTKAWRQELSVADRKLQEHQFCARTQ